MSNILNETLNTPKYIPLGDFYNKSVHAGDIVEITLNLNGFFKLNKKLIIKIPIQKDIYLKNTALIMSGINQEIDSATAKATLLGYELCNRYQRNEINIIICLAEK